MGIQNHAVSADRLKVDAFREFLTAHGAAVLAPTNEWEVLRFEAKGKTSIVHKNKRGQLTWGGDSADAYHAMVTHGPWSGNNTVKRQTGKNRVKIKALIDRDGEECFFCGLGPDEHGWTIEHLFSIIHGGRNHIANLALAHSACNQAAGHLSVAEKVKLRDEVRSDIAAVSTRKCT